MITVTELEHVDSHTVCYIQNCIPIIEIYSASYEEQWALQLSAYCMRNDHYEIVNRPMHNATYSHKRNCSRLPYLDLRRLECILN
jgi:hypothetical protein